MARKVTFVLFLSCALTVFQIGEGTRKRTNENPVVITPLGQIRGSLLISRLGKTIYAFRGIRYAKPPIDELRFQPPVPVEKWEGVYDATKDGFLCPQPSADPTSEDCLMTNVYSTKLPKGSENPKRPVVVYIHPGGFYSATSVSYRVGPQYFLDQDIVLVTFSYRLGSLGFLSTGDKEAPGNNGLKDQVELLKWVKHNIEAFGGDPDRVTIQGYSAGSRSVILHLVSPLSQDLFHRAVAMSGSLAGGWNLPHHQLEIAKKQARLVGCPYDTGVNIVKCLKTKSFKELADSLSGFREFGFDPVVIWTPVIENDFGQARFLTGNPVDLIQSGKFKKVPFITGVNTDEFGYFAFNVVNNQTLTKEINSDFNRVAPIAFIYERGTNRSRTISEDLRSFYLHDKPIDKSQFTALANLYADSIVGFPINRIVKLISRQSSENVYYYRFSYQGRYSHFYLPGSNNTTPYGVVHHDDLIYLLYNSRRFPWFNTTDPEVEMVEKLTTLYANFATTGNPTPTTIDKLDNVKWETFNQNTQRYLEIGNKLEMREKLHVERYAEWEKLFPLNDISKKEHKHK